MNGKMLKHKWGIEALHVLYRQTGTWYHYLNRFPGAYCDRHGYVIFATEQSYNTAFEYLSFGKTVHAPNGIKAMPNYVFVE